MKTFTELFEKVDNTTSTLDKVRYLSEYFGSVPPEDAAWAVFLLSGRRRKKSLTSAKLRRFFQQLSGLPDWLYQESYGHVGDTAETISLLAPSTIAPVEPSVTQWLEIPLHDWMENIIPDLEKRSEEEQARQLNEWWSSLPPIAIFVLNKLMTGEFRVGISNKLVIKGLAKSSGVAEATIHHRLLGYTLPSAEAYTRLFEATTSATEPSAPYPFFLASPLEDDSEIAARPEDWVFEWKWDGIRAQLIRRSGQSFLWSRGEEIVSESFPEIMEESQKLPDGTVLDGELLAWQDDKPLPFAVLQTRLNRKKVSPKMRESSPVALLVYDILEHEGSDLRELSWTKRRELMEKVVKETNSDLIRLYPYFEFKNWSDVKKRREQSRANFVEGLMIKRRQSPYRTGRVRGDWWKYKVDPYTLDAVLIYAQAGSGKRANLFTDYTFALKHGDKYVPFAKAYSGLDQKEIEELDRWIRRHTTEKFGPVRSVKIEHVFEIAFEGIQSSSRHKAGIAVRFPRILRWRRDKKPEEIDTLESAIRLAESTTVEALTGESAPSENASANKLSQQLSFDESGIQNG